MSRRSLPWILIALSVGAGVFAVSRPASTPSAPRVATPTVPAPTTVPRLVFAPSDGATFLFAAERGVRGDIAFGFEIAADGSVQNVVTTSDADPEVLRRFAADLQARRYEPAPAGSSRQPLQVSATFTVGGS